MALILKKKEETDKARKGRGKERREEGERRKGPQKDFTISHTHTICL